MKETIFSNFITLDILSKWPCICDFTILDTLFGQGKVEGQGGQGGQGDGGQGGQGHGQNQTQTNKKHVRAATKNKIKQTNKKLWPSSSSSLKWLQDYNSNPFAY